MYRSALTKLQEWKDRPKRKPLIIRGARQVGKTWLMKEFGRTSFANTAYINFDNNRRMRILFEDDYDLKRIITALQIESGVKITPEDTLIVFDEVQEVPQALTALKYFYENAPEYAVVAAGSLLGIAMHQGTNFPVGKVDELQLYPLSFREFLLATENAPLVDLLDHLDWPLITTFKSKYIDLLRQYYYVGGMPEAVAAYVERGDFAEVRTIQNALLAAYEQDFSKHAPNNIVPRLRMVWQSIPAQLAKENRKFIYGMLREGARAKDFEVALQWLADCGLIHRVHRVSKPGMPLKAYHDLTAFKLYLLDVGLLTAMGDIDVRTLLGGNDIFVEFKGALTEQYVLQQLIAEVGVTPYYWSSEHGTGEIDFLFQLAGTIIPLEVKAEENLRARSLRSFNEKYPGLRPVRTSMSDHRQEAWMENWPLYAIGNLE